MVIFLSQIGYCCITTWPLLKFSSFIFIIMGLLPLLCLPNTFHCCFSYVCCIFFILFFWSSTTQLFSAQTQPHSLFNQVFIPAFSKFVISVSIPLAFSSFLIYFLRSLGRLLERSRTALLSTWKCTSWSLFRFSATFSNFAPLSTLLLLVPQNTLTTKISLQSSSSFSPFQIIGFLKHDTHHHKLNYASRSQTAD